MNEKARISKPENRDNVEIEILKFKFSSLEFVSNFVFRASDLQKKDSKRSLFFCVYVRPRLSITQWSGIEQGSEP